VDINSKPQPCRSVLCLGDIQHESRGLYVFLHRNETIIHINWFNDLSSFLCEIIAIIHLIYLICVESATSSSESAYMHDEQFIVDLWLNFISGYMDGALSHPISGEKPDASHMCARI
jgi:hypothetical protein